MALSDNADIDVCSSHDEQYFRDKLEKLRAEIGPKIPSMDPSMKHLLHTSCVSVVAAQKARDAAKKAQDKASTPEEKDATSAALAAAEEALTQAVNAAVEASTPLLDDLEGSLLLNDSLDYLLAPCSILTRATPKYLADFCAKGESQQGLIDDLFNDLTLMKDMLYAGGAKDNKYGEVMQIYHDVDASSKEGILYRLALGTSLELAVPMNEFDSKNLVDPVKRYRHYEHAFQHGELDPSVQDRTTWECRYITNSDAPNDQLQWVRDMLKNYRPDHMELDYTWRYVYAVRSDVTYNNPQWTSSPHTYQQIISGGGKCGPRAWFGRFILRAFGIPTWGVRQPGHAALGHWTPTGWVMCLGAAWKFSYWEGPRGPDFVLEAQAREQRDDYVGVCRLEWVADALGEPPIHDKLNPDCPWRSLALLQTHRLANKTMSFQECPETCSILDRVQEQEPPVGEKEYITFKHNGKIVIPAVACTSPSKPTRNAFFMKSILGGMQLHIQNDQSIEYKLSRIPRPGIYHLSIRLVNVHLKNKPLLLTITADNDENDSPVSIASIPIPYTVGMWDLTDPVQVELESGTNILTFTRETSNFGVTIKELILTPFTEDG